MHAHPATRAHARASPPPTCPCASAATRLTVDDADANNPAVVTCQHPLALPCSQSPDTDAPVVGAGNEAVGIASEGQDEATVT